MEEQKYLNLRYSIKAVAVNSINKKVKVFFHLLVLLCWIESAKAQPGFNLIPNSSFEITDTAGILPLPRTIDPWYSPNGSTPDILNSFFSDSCFYCVPENYFGFQYPHSQNGYAFLGLFSTTPSYEYLSVNLKNSIGHNRTGCFQIYLNTPSIYADYYCNNFCVYLSIDTPYCSPAHTCFIPVSPQFCNDTSNQLSDTLNWNLIQGNIIGLNGERIITLGNFYGPNDPNLSLHTGPSTSFSAGIFIDDVSLYELKALPSKDTVVCPGTAFPIPLYGYGGYDTYLWSTGDTTKDVTVSSTGTFTLTASNWCGTVTDTIEVKMFDTLLVQNLLGANKSICAEQFPYSLSPLQNMGILSNYVWSNGSNSEQIQVNEPGTYWLTNTYYCGTVTDSITVNLLPSPNLNLGADTTLCIGQQLQLSAPDSLQYYWSNGSNNKTIVVDTTANITLLVLNQFGCSNKDSVQVIYEQAYHQFLPNDTSLFEGNILSIAIPNNLNNVLWNDGSAAMQRDIAEAGFYIVQASDENDCLLSDSVSVNFKPFNPQLPGLIMAGEFFIIRNLPPGAKLEVFNSIGQLVFRSDSYQNEWQPDFADAVFLARLTLPDHEVFVSKFLCFGR